MLLGALLLTKHTDAHFSIWCFWLYACCLAKVMHIPVIHDLFGKPMKLVSAYTVCVAILAGFIF